MIIKNKTPVTLKFFGQFHFFIKDKWGVSFGEVSAPEDGKTGFEIAKEIGLPIEKIEAVFRNGLVQNIYDKVFPGDRVAFVPYGTPGPYRVFLGMIRENKERVRREKDAGLSQNDKKPNSLIAETD
jgi:hypothetical protein